MIHYAPVDRALCRWGIKSAQKTKDRVAFLARPDKCKNCLEYLERSEKPNDKKQNQKEAET